MHVGVEVLHNAADGWIAPALRNHLGAETDIVGAAVDKMMTDERGEGGKEVVGVLRRCKLRADFRAVAFGDAGDDRFLGGKVTVEVARAHPGFSADVLHRGLMEAR